MAEPLRLVSVHDLIPEKMAAVRATVEVLDEHAVAPLTLLVCPGFDWPAAELQWLQQRQRRGDRLAGHGWRHAAGPARGLYDRLHRAVFSRGVAEHLALDSDGIAQMIADNFAWFGAHGFAAPELYVPPAWAMGAIKRERLRRLPFRLYETLGGVYDSRANTFDHIPLLGFEADTAFRAATVRASNRVNRLLALRNGRLRVSIHPTDLRLHLAQELRATLAEPARYSHYG